MSNDPTQHLAEFFSGLTYDRLPAETRALVVDIILDTFASAIAGRLGDETAQIEALAQAIGGPKNSTVLAGPPQSLAGAVLVNGYQVTAVTVCDIHRPTLCHVTPEVIPPALAVAEARHLPGRAFVTAVAAGLEAVVRVGAGMRYSSMRKRGWHSPGVIGPFGGASAIGVLMGLDPLRFRNALALAGTQAAGTFAHWGTPTIKFHQSRGAFSGFLAAHLAETGFRAGTAILTAPHGGLFNLYSDGGDPAAVSAGLGEDWQLGTISLRLWPAASSIQSVITALLALVEANDIRPDQVERVDVGLSKTVYDMHGTLPWDNKFRALLSTPYVTGVVLHDRKCWFDQFTPERIADPALDAFIRERIVVAADETVEGTGAVVTITRKDGTKLTDRRAFPRGDAADRLSREEIMDKFRTAAKDLLPSDKAEQAIEKILNIENVEDMAEICRLVAAPAKAS